MPTSPQQAFSAARPGTPSIPQRNLLAERAYQGVTIAAMIWLLGSLWLFR